MQGKANYFLIGDLLQLPWVHQIIAIFGILFDLLIIPALLWKPSRKYAFIFAVFFHLANSIIFQIGIFPYLALAFTVFFFDPKKIRALFFKNTLTYTPAKIITPKFKTLILGIWMLYFIFQIGLPLRHHFFKDDVLWTEEGHRLSWRMMLRKRSGTVHFNIVDKQTNTTTRVNLTHYLTKKQIRKIGAYPDFIWQFAQHLKKEAKKNNKEIAVFANARVSINGKPKQQLIDPKVDLAQEKWHHFKHNAFILPSSK